MGPCLRRSTSKRLSRLPSKDRGPSGLRSEKGPLSPWVRDEVGEIEGVTERVRSAREDRPKPGTPTRSEEGSSARQRPAVLLELAQTVSGGGPDDGDHKRLQPRRAVERRQRAGRGRAPEDVRRTGRSRLRQQVAPPGGLLGGPVERPPRQRAKLRNPPFSGAIHAIPRKRSSEKTTPKTLG